MSDWQVGDLAACVDDSPSRTSMYSVRDLRAGVVYRVLRVNFEARVGTCLLVDGATSEHPTGEYRAYRFRKVRPDQHEACEPEFVTLLKKRKVDA